MNKKEGKGYVYFFLQCIKTNVVKIGETTREVKERIVELSNKEYPKLYI
ncbi:hypothetical protein [Cytobacillus depressus]|nr:hypothetical protein [Cytobacillus depressus]